MKFIKYELSTGRIAGSYIYAPNEDGFGVIEVDDSFDPNPWTHIVQDGEIVPTPENTEALDLFKATALSSVDNIAGYSRLRYITSVPGQAETYAAKEAQARQWEATAFAGPAPSFIAAEASALGVAPADLAAEIIMTADLWQNDKGPAIEACRRKWKVQIGLMTSEAEVSAAVSAARAELDAL